MSWMVYVAGTVFCWGLYGVVLHRGQVQLGNPLRALLCVGMAYFLIGVLVPATALWLQGDLKGFNQAGTVAATLAGALGAAGAIGIIWAFRAGGLPTYVMPLVFGGAPLVNVAFALWLHPPRATPSPMLYVGFLLTAVGAGLVLYYKPAS